MAEDVLNGCYDEAAEFVRALARKDAPYPSIEDVFPFRGTLPRDGKNRSGERRKNCYRENLTQGTMPKC